METAEINIGKAIRCSRSLAIPLHLENGINRRRLCRVARTGYIDSPSSYSTENAIQVRSLSKRQKERKREREVYERKEKDGITVIDYVNDQPSERCSDSSPAANAITIWQFAAVRLHLTRIKIAAIIAAHEKETERERGREGEREREREKERERERNREIDQLLRLDRPALNGLARMGANIDRN